MTPRRAIVISIDGLAAFYWTDPSARTEGLRALAERGVAAARMETVFPSTTWPTHASLVTGVSPDRHGVVGNSILNRRTWTPEDLTGDLLLEATPGYAFADDAQGDAIVGAPHYRGNHGHLPTHPDNGAFFLAAGASIVRGRTLATVRSRDVGPTVAHVLGLRMDATDGRVLDEILAV